MHHLSQHDGEWQNRAELNCLLDILAISSRTDLKKEIIKEIERHTKCFIVFSQNPKVDHQKIKQSIDKLSQLSDNLLASKERIDYILTEVNLLKCLAQRNSIPGGTCDFDLPAYHFWLNKTLKVRREDIHAWTKNLGSIRESIFTLLQFIRFSAKSSSEIAHSGFYQQSLETIIPVQLLRVSTDINARYFAEVSGGKHRFTVRFMQPQESERPLQSDCDVEFTLSICQL
ncbi:MAG: cell division protein ZapD [Cycloclasticus sp. symbiont of Poecilosclerida sp. N]|nr:MAG: cell division protein ZapD [Cycloclasticus sp. symbiont of Poecilosclerida sp. N]